MSNNLYFLKILLIYTVIQNVHWLLVQSEETDYEFYIETENMTNWFQAWNNCAARHMFLVALNSKNKSDALTEELKKIYGNNHPNIWIGGSGKNGQHIWASNKETFTYKNWASGQPDNKGGREHCVLIWNNHDYKWNDGVCLNEMLYVCEKK